MTAVKSAGMGDNFYIGGYNLSGDVGSLGTISGGNTPLEVTSIDMSAFDRLGGLRNGTVEFTTFFDDQTGQEHPILSTLPRTDTQCMYLRGTPVGNQAAAMVAKQINYDGTRSNDGAFTLNVQALSNAYGLEWGVNMTAGVRTDTAATLGASWDSGAAASFGAQAYLQVFSFSGTDVQMKFEDSADNSAWALTSPVLQFTSLSAAPTFERVAVSNTSTLRRYLRVKTTTSAGFTSCSFAVILVKNTIAGQVF